MMIHFIRPLWLLALIPITLYLVWLICSPRQNNPWRTICDPHLLPTLLQNSISTSRRFFYTILFLFFFIAIFALAGPAWKKTTLPVYKELNSRMLVLDLSPAMLINDLRPDRLMRAKFKIRDLINASQNSQMGLVVFSNEAFVAAPLSQDANTLNALLDELNPQMMPISGSDMGQGLNQALTLLNQTGVQHSNLILITASEPTANSWTAAKMIRQAGNQLNILAMLESNAKTQSTIEALKQLASVGGGSFYLFTPDAADIKSILRNDNVTQVVKDQNLENANLWQDAGPWFCLLLIPLILLVLREKAL